MNISHTLYGFFPNYDFIVPYNNCCGNESVMNSYEEDFHNSHHGWNSLLYMYMVIFIIGLISNVCVLFQIARRFNTINTTSIFVFNLGVADLFLMLCTLIIIVRLILGEWIFGSLMCKVYFTIDGANKFASVAFLVLLSGDRYLAVCHPVRSIQVRTTRVATSITLITWVVVFLLTSPVFFVTELFEDADESRVQCTFVQYPNDNSTSWLLDPRRMFTFYSFALTYVIPVLMISLFYAMIICRLRRQENRFPTIVIHSSTSCSNLCSTSASAVGGHQRRKQPSRRISIMVLVIVSAYTVCWLPYWYLQIGLEFFADKLLGTFGESFQTFCLVAYGMQISNSALNPIIYAFCANEGRRQVSRLFEWICFRSHNIHFRNRLTSEQKRSLMMESHL